ncbi:TlyA family RNA methyltransferase [Sulfurimonas sp. C5]|uniref:23S rRNA (cytidine-2'-O)-methyltransferase TlyA n=1 Tax=Sulfurimonas sp. C5 TaxID=3036947 RepID=UPI0024545A90|nr:TlyA family RNA methyltransferase [Sulfurimonas sp. C5]MDH4943565.1 TlyA family RNA methyltransferase [Sulfurimonas sp. C5]
MRLDSYLVEKGFAETRNKAQTLIKEGLVLIDSKEITKPSFKVDEGMEVNVKEHKSYVSRAAYKLKDFIEEIHYDPSGKMALDIGSSTGGFTQVLLEAGAKEVTCVDVGSDQLHHSLRNDERVHVFENCDIRKFEGETPFELIVSDVAFISLLYILDDIDRLASKDIILLYKPQFEVGREVKRDKNGVVTDKKAIENGMIRFEDACRLKGWKLRNKAPSRTTGKEGNLEYCYYFEK